MDGATATGPLIALGAAVLGLVLLAVTAALLFRAPRRPAEPSGSYVRDDLAAFRARPPGSPGAVPLPAGGDPVLLAVPRSATAVERTTPRPRRSALPQWLLGLATAALLVVVAAAGVSLATRGQAAVDEPATSTQSAAVPPLPAPPASPAPGEAGAGRLGLTSLPLGPGDVAARLTFDGVVLEQHAVGVTVTYPTVSVTTHGALALAHVRLPTFNCLTADVPADPLRAGCVPSVTEYADLPTPALQVTHDGTRLSLRGLFPTYVRPNGSPPVYTGLVYDFSVTATAGRPLGHGRSAAEGTLSLGTQTAQSIGGAALSVFVRGS